MNDAETKAHYEYLMWLQAEQTKAIDAYSNDETEFPFKVTMKRQVKALEAQRGLVWDEIEDVLLRHPAESKAAT